MIKRLNKKIAMLVATASVVSMVPAIGVSASTTTRLETQEGKIENAIAYKDGKYIYEGYKGEDESALYYFDGSKDKTLKDSDDEDLDDAELVSKYGAESVKIKDSDEYLVDLSTGKVSEDDSDSYTDDAKTALKKQLKKAEDRYEVTEESDITSFSELSNKNFEDVYFQYTAKGEDGKSYTGFTNKSGKYIDASYTANIYAYSSVRNKVVKLEKFDDEDKDTKLTATLDSIKVIAQDNDYIYTLSKITVKDSNIATVTETTTASAVTVGVNQSVTGTYIQKISKAQGEQEDDTYLPKSVTSYQVNNGIFDDDDADKATKVIADADEYFVKDGKLFAIEAESDKITVTELVLKKTNLDFTTAPTGAETKNTVQLVQADDDEDTDMETATSYTIDAKGNLWIINNGKVKEFTGSSFDEIYSTDSSFDILSVYDKDNLIVWANGDDDFAVTGKSTTTTETKATDADATTAVVKAETSKLQADVDSAKALVKTLDEGTVKTDLTNRLDAVQKAIPTTVTVKAGWNKNEVTGIWTYGDANGALLKSQWKQDGANWYYLNADGSMATGWNKIGDVWYYLNTNGSMATGWVKDGGSWYFLNDNGSMASGWLSNNGAWYFLNSSGVMKTGWIKVEGNWYFLNDNGSMASNTSVGGYQLGSDGAWIQ